MRDDDWFRPHPNAATQMRRTNYRARSSRSPESVGVEEGADVGEGDHESGVDAVGPIVRAWFNCAESLSQPLTSRRSVTSPKCFACWITEINV